MDEAELKNLLEAAIDEALNKPRPAPAVEVENRAGYVREELARVTNHDFRADNGPESRPSGFPGMRGRPARRGGISLITGDE